MNRLAPHFGRTTFGIGRIGLALLCIVMLFLGSLPISIVGTAYVLDFAIPSILFVLMLIDERVREILYMERWPIVMGGISVLAFVATDLLNKNEHEWLLRGIGTNVGCWLSFVIGIVWLSRWGLRSFLVLFAACMLSLPLALYVAGDADIRSAVVLFKFSNGMFLLVPALLLISRPRWLIVALLALVGVYLYSACDFRSGAAVAITTALWLALRHAMHKMRARAIGILILVVVPAGTIAALTAARELALHDEERSSRQDSSDAIRLEMALDAMNRILARPIIGYGSWQHVMLFESSDPLHNQALQGVHSFPLQLAFEYGLFGFTIAILISVKLVQVIARLTARGSQFVDLPTGTLACIMYILLITLANVLYGGMMGFARFTVGFEIALVWWLDRRLRKPSQMTRIPANWRARRLVPGT